MCYAAANIAGTILPMLVLLQLKVSLPCAPSSCNYKARLPCSCHYNAQLLHVPSSCHYKARVLRSCRYKARLLCPLRQRLHLWPLQEQQLHVACCATANAQEQLLLQTLVNLRL